MLDSIFEIPLLKYNGETDQYLFKDVNTVYSLQLYQVEHEMAINKTSSKTLLPGQKPFNPKIVSQHSIQISEDSELD